MKSDLIFFAAALAALAVWAWFWTGPELRWERCAALHQCPAASQENLPHG